MAAKVSLSQIIECSEAEFWKSFFDPALNKRLFLEGLGFRGYETVEQKETDEAITRTTRVEPKLALPGPVAKVFGSSFHYGEQGRFDKATKVWRWKMIPSTMTDKLHVDGKLEVTPIGEDKVRRDIEIALEAKVMMIGGLIEDTFKKQLSDGWQKGADVQNAWLRQGK